PHPSVVAGCREAAFGRPTARGPLRRVVSPRDSGPEDAPPAGLSAPSDRPDPAPPATRTAGATGSAPIAASPTRPGPRPPTITPGATTRPRGLQALPGRSCGPRARGGRRRGSASVAGGFVALEDPRAHPLRKGGGRYAPGSRVLHGYGRHRA